MSISGFDQQAAARRFQHFRERSVPRLDDRNAVRQRFQDVDSFRLVIDGRHREDVERLEEADFCLVRRRAPRVFECRA